MSGKSTAIRLTKCEENPQEETADCLSQVTISAVGSSKSSPENILNYNTFNPNTRDSQNERHEMGEFRMTDQGSGSDQSICKQDSSFIQAFFNFVKAFIGLGVLSAAHSMRHAGCILGGAGMIFSGALSMYGTNIGILARRKFLRDAILNEINSNNQLDAQVSSEGNTAAEIDNGRLEVTIVDENNQQTRKSLGTNQSPLTNVTLLLKYNNTIRTYPELGKAAYGDKAYKIITFILFWNQLGTVTAYLYFADHWFESYAVCLAILPIGMFSDMKHISYASLISLMIITPSLITLGGISIAEYGEHSRNDFKYIDVFQFPLFFGVGLFIFEGDIVALNVESSMKNPRDFYKVSVFGIIFVTLGALAMGELPYISYVNHSKDIIIDTISHSAVKILLKIGYIIAITLSLPIQMYPVSDTFYHTTFLDDYVPLFRENPAWKFRIGTVGSMFFCLLIAMILPDLGSFFNITGAAFGVITTILMPILMYNKAYEDSISSWRWYFHLILSVVMVALGVLALVATIIDQAM